MPRDERLLSLLGDLRSSLDGLPDTENLVSWSGDEIIEVLAEWGFSIGELELEQRLVVHRDHADLDMYVPMYERVSYVAVVQRVVELIDTLVSRLETEETVEE